MTQITQNAAGTTSTKITVPNTLADMGYDGNGNLKKISIEKKVGGVVQSTITTVRTYDALNRVTILNTLLILHLAEQNSERFNAILR